MPEYLAPGVLVEEVSSRPQSIEGVPTSTAGFVGACRDGPVGVPTLVTSLAEYQRLFGDSRPLSSGPHVMWHAAHAFFGNGGRRLYVSRVAQSPAGGNDTTTYAAGLQALETVDEVALVAAPGASVATAALIAHAEAMRYRLAVLDSPPGLSVEGVRTFRRGLSSSHAALYYPWVTVADPLTGKPMNVPPSGFVAGICARVDAERGVWKAPANEVLHVAVGLERAVTAAEQDVLNPEGINCLRALPGKGLRVWGARTLGADSQWRYVSVRRLFAYLEQSIERGTQWAVFEPNGEALWARVRQVAEDFLLAVWRNGALMGSKPAEAFFVRCDRTTMAQDDLDNGRLVALVGVAPVKPAEFVIFRIGQWTADAKT